MKKLTGCEITNCPDYWNNKCHNESDYVNKDTGEAMCPKNDNSIPRDEYKASK